MNSAPAAKPEEKRDAIHRGLNSAPAAEPAEKRDAMNRVSTTTGGITGIKNPMLFEISLSKIIRWYKGRCKFEINKMQNEIFFAWQPKFYDRIIRDENELNNTRQYIIDNPIKWQADENYKM